VRRILWDVDTQVDFMLPSGKLYVPRAEKTAPAMARLVAAARAAGVPHIASADDHELTDPEISDEPDWQSTFPPHCLRGTPGAQKIDETGQADPLPLTLVPYPALLLADRVREHREILLLKKSVDVFTNPNVDALLTAFDPDEVIVFGVATDVCDDLAIRGLRRRGRRVVFVEDAARALDEERATACTRAWRDQGVTFVTTDDAIELLRTE
jgi:nicotinamidase/pyrazinamidase